MATFRKRGESWQAQIRLKGHLPLSRSFRSKSEAEQWVRQTEAAIDRAESLSPRNVLRQPSLDSLLERYVRTVTPSKKGKASEVYRIRILRRHSIANRSLDELTSAAVASYRDERLGAVSTSSVCRELAVLQHCLHVAIVDWGIPLQTNPVTAIKKPRPTPPRQRRIGLNELEALKEALGKCRNPLVAKIVHFAIHTGMRRSEILSFRWSDLDIFKRTVHLPDSKNGHPRTVPLTPVALTCLRRAHSGRQAANPDT